MIRRFCKLGSIFGEVRVNFRLDFRKNPRQISVRYSENLRQISVEGRRSRSRTQFFSLQNAFAFKLMCPETPFVSHENPNFLFSVFRVVQGEAKTPKIMGCCKALIFFTCCKDWLFSWKIRISVQSLTFLSIGSLFFNQQ